VAIEVIKLIDDPRLVLGVVEVAGGTVRPLSASMTSNAAEIAAEIADPAWELPEEQRRAVRSLLKVGGYSPTGRGRPAHEYLINDIKERGSFLHINNVVDINNIVSLQAKLPVSIFDAGKLSGDVVTVRIGVEGEGYVFNPAGQWLDVKRCIVCCDGEPPGTPIGSPVKDSMATKVFEGATHYLGVIYGTTELYDITAMTKIAGEFAELLASETGGSVVQTITI
jgi:DNA/RNA-binding domain of Phe-tRNA-synthetase-like protein